MALIVCPECQRQMSETAAACPQCGWAHAAILRTTEARRLLGLSTKIMLVGFVAMFGGCGAGIAFGSPASMVTAVVLGCVIILAAGVVGQIGRAKQGRII